MVLGTLLENMLLEEECKWSINIMGWVQAMKTELMQLESMIIEGKKERQRGQRNRECSSPLLYRCYKPQSL